MPQSNITIASDQVHTTSDQVDTTSASINIQSEIQIDNIQISKKHFIYLLVSAFLILILELIHYIILLLKLI